MALKEPKSPFFGYFWIKWPAFGQKWKWPQKMLGGYEQGLLERLNSRINYGILVSLCPCRKLNLVLCRLIIGAIGKSFHGGSVFWI